MKILAIDYGARHIGLALSDDEQKFAFAYNTLETKNKKQKTKNKIISDLQNICKIEKVERVIVGMPINLSGEKTKSTELVFNFVRELEDGLDVPVDVEDERLTTVQASRIKEKGARNIDELSAQIMLQNYLDKNNL